MPEGQVLVLNVLVEGHFFFEVKLRKEDGVNTLKNLVREQGKSRVFRDVDPAELVLLKVNIDLNMIGSESLTDLKFEKSDKGVEELLLWRSVLDYWPNQPPTDHLHVVAKVPRRPELPTAVLGEQIRSVKDEWREGWRRLYDSNQWKLFGDYWRKQDVETTRDRPSITLAYEERGEGDPEYRLPLSPETDDEIYPRDCYKRLYDFVLKSKDTPECTGLILTGQPGTGKTVWVAYTLARLLTEKKTVVYHVDGRTYLFFENSVYFRISGEDTKMPRTDQRIICLIDPDRMTDELEISFMTRPKTAFCVIASSPNPSRYKIFQKQRQTVSMQFMPLWTRDELKNGLKMQDIYDDLRREVETALCASPVDNGSTMPEDQTLSALQMVRDEQDDIYYNPTLDEVLDRILDNTIEAFGSSARDVYSAIRDPKKAEKRVDNALKDLKYDDLRRAVMNMYKVEAAIGELPYCIFSMRVNEARLARPGLVASFEVQFKSRWIQTRTLKRLDFLRHIDTAAEIRDLRLWAERSGLSGFLHEGSAAKVLAAGNALPLVLMTASDGKTTFSVPAGEPTTTSSPFNRPRELSYAHFTTTPRALDFRVNSPGKPLSDYFWLPMARNNALFDAFIIEFDDSTEPISAVVWILRMSESLHHGGSPEGYQLIKLIKAKAKQAMQQRVGKKEVGEVTVKYVLVNPGPGKWKLPEMNWAHYQGHVYYQRVALSR